MATECRRSTDNSVVFNLEELNVKIARLEEKLVASDRALELARSALTAWQVGSNEWRQENIDQRSQYITIDKAQALIAVEASLRGALEGRIYAVEQSRQIELGKHEAINMTWVIIAFIVTSGIAVASFLFRSLK